MNAPLKHTAEAATDFVRRHIGPSPRDIDAMLETVGANSLGELMGQTLPSSIRQKAITGAPVRSEPKTGKAWAWRPSRNAATDSNSADVTTPWPPRPWKRTWYTPESVPHRARSAIREGPRP